MLPSLPPTPSAIVAACGILGLGAAEIRAAHEEKRMFDLPQGDAALTLKHFAAAGVPIVYLVDRVRGSKTNAVHGVFTPRVALEKMLAGSGLQAEQDAATGAFVVSRQRRTGSPPPAGKVENVQDLKPKSESKAMNTPRNLLAAVIGWLAASTAVEAQPAASAPPKESTVVLSPFEVTAENDQGYVAGNTLGATRVNTLIRDLPLHINVVTEDMIRDFIAYDLDQVIDHLPGVSREFNETVPTYSIRGFSSSAAMRNGVRTLHAPDTNSVARVEVIKGPAALLYGTSNPGGVINYITRQPGSRPRAEVTAAFGTNAYQRYSFGIGGPLPVGDGKKFSYLLDAAWFEHEHGERQRSLRRYSLAPVLRWTPFESTSITLRAAKQHDDFLSTGGLILLPPNHPIRTSTSTPRIPHWSVELGRDYNIHSPASWVDVDSNVVELEVKQRINRSIDLRVNLAEHYRPRSSFREGGSNFLNAGTVVGQPFVPSYFAPDTPASLFGVAPAYDPVARTGWRTVSSTIDNRVERRRSMQVDLVGRKVTGPFDQTLLVGFERNLEGRSSRNHSWADIDANGVVRSVSIFTYAPFDPVSTAAKDRYYMLNQPPLDTLPISGYSNTYSNNSSFYSSLTTRFLEHRGLVLIGGRFDDVRGGTYSISRNIVTGALGTPTFNQGTTDRLTPQAGISYRIAEPITAYLMSSRSVNPRITFQPLRTAVAEQRITEAFTNAGEPTPNLDNLPWGQLLEPEFGTSLEYGFKWELFRRRLQGTVAAFNIERRNVTTPTEGTLGTAAVGFLDLAGRTRARGLDLDIAFSPTRDFQIVGGMLFNETEILFDTTRTEIGKRMRNAPKWSGNLTSRYTVSRGALTGVAFGGSWNYMGARRENDALRWSEKWQRFDIFGSYRRKFGQYPVTFALNVKNLLDRSFRVDRDTFAAGREFRFSMTLQLK